MQLRIIIQQKAAENDNPLPPEQKNTKTTKLASHYAYPTTYIEQ